MEKDAPKTTHPRHWRTPALTAILIVSLAGNGYLWYTLSQQNSTVASLKSDKAALGTEGQALLSQLAAASSTIEDLTDRLTRTAEALDELQDDYKKEKNKNEEFEDQLTDLGDLVGDLDKLSKTDKELLAKYSKVYFLNENYTPTKLRQIDDGYILPGRDVQFFQGDALSFLEEMLDDAAEDGVDLKIISAYRSFDVQTQLKGQYTVTYGSGANAFSADQGYSEHQLGTTVDLTVASIGGAYTSFKDTEAYQWLQKNAYRYGFIESYPEGNSYYVYEPWHWRFVGTDLARDLHRDGAHFYDWDQREIDTYLIKLFD